MPVAFNWTNKVVDALCQNVASGMSIRQASKEKGAPSEASIYRRMASDDAFAAQLGRAREAQQDHEADACVEMADEATSDDWQVVRLRIWARQWRAGKLAPKKYGDKQQIEHSGSIDSAAAIIEARKRSGTSDS